MEAWTIITLNKVDNTNGVLTALFPATCPVFNPAGTTAGSKRRRQTAGTLCRCEVKTVDAAGGQIFLYDVDGLFEGADNNVSTGDTMTAAFYASKVALGQAKLLWTQNFKGDAGSRAAIFQGLLPFTRGLAAQYVNAAGTSATISLVVDGGYFVSEICGS
jgi:hypothetical protein